MRELDWHFDKTSGLLQGACYHDANLTDFIYHQDFLKLGIRCISGEKVFLSFKNIKEINAKDFWGPAIILDIEGWRVCDATSDFIRTNVWKFLFKNRCKEEQIRESSNRLIAQCPDYYIVMLTSSYGLTLALICETILIEEN